jgi:hypothetical protein
MPTDFASKMLEFAYAEVGARETPGQRNRGPQVDQYCRDIGHDPTKGDPWCVIFVAAMAKRAADFLGIKCPVPLVAGCWTVDQNSPPIVRTMTPTSGSIFLTLLHKHCGLVTDAWDDGTLSTCEGNTDPAGSAEGDGVYLRTTRKKTDMAIFLDFNLLGNLSNPRPLVG